MKTPRPRSTEPSAALPDTRVRVVLPPPLVRCWPALDELEAGHPVLRGTFRDYATQRRRALPPVLRLRSGSVARCAGCAVAGGGTIGPRAVSGGGGDGWGGEGDPDGVVQPSPGTPSLPNSSTGSSSACSPPPAACSSRRLIDRELERLVDSTPRAGPGNETRLYKTTARR